MTGNAGAMVSSAGGVTPWGSQAPGRSDTVSEIAAQFNSQTYTGKNYYSKFHTRNLESVGLK